MADFTPAYLVGRENEGFYTNDPHDSGGETYAGISRINYPKWAGWAIIDKYQPLKHGQRVEDAELESLIKQFYYTNFWQKMQGDLISLDKFSVYFYDWYINSQKKAVMRLQEVMGMEQTGNFGNLTLSKVNSYEDEALLKLIHERRVKFYNDHCALVPSDAGFLNGWLSRANGLYNKLA